MRAIFLVITLAFGIFLQTIAALQASCESIFTPLFGQNAKHGAESFSGDGSNLTQTSVIRQKIPELLAQYQCKTMVDAPCGDFFWMRHVPLDVEKYTGVDVIRDLISTNQRSFGDSKRSFRCLDITKEVVPQADLILCRDCLVHLSYADIASVLFMFKKSGSRFLLTTTFPGHSENRDIKNGEWRPINLMDPPFHFPKPLAIINENCTEQGGIFKDKSLALWCLDDIPLLNSKLLLKSPITVLTQPLESFNPDPWEHPAVTRSIKTGLEKIGFPYNFNPRITEVYENVLVLNNFRALEQAISWKKQGKVKKLLVGPNLTIRGVEAQVAPEIDYCITPSEWVKQSQIEDQPRLAGRIKIWPSGIDSTYWVRDEAAVLGNNVLVYCKQPSDEFCVAVESLLRINGWNPIRIVYGMYKIEQYKEALSQSRFAIFLSASETQGLALAECWSMNVPTLVWDPKNFFDSVHWFRKSSSSPYLNDQLGKDWQDLTGLEKLLGDINSNLQNYAPRKWVLNNMTDEISAYDLVRIFQQS